MPYEAAMNKAWDNLVDLTREKNFSVKFLGDEYSIDLKNRLVTSLDCNTTAKDFYTILILHYLFAKLKGLARLTGEWLTFRELAGIEGYAAAFRKRALEPIVRKYAGKPENILSVLDKLPSRKADFKDISIIIEAFSQVPVLLKLSFADEEFSCEANMLFDRNLTSIFCIEDIVVLAGIVAASV